MSSDASVQHHPAILPFRGILAVLVVLQHIADLGFGMHQTRVVLFFVISGYCIFAAADSLQRRAAPSDSSPALARGFLRRRVWRIWPPYAFSLIYLVIVANILGPTASGAPGGYWRTAPTTWEWVTNLTLTPWTSMLQTPRTFAWQNPDLIVRTHWTLGYEVQFYFLVALAVLLSSRRRSLLPALGVFLGLLGAAGLVLDLLILPKSRGLIIDFSWCFALGALVHFRLRPLHAEARASHRLNWSLAAVAAFLGLLWLVTSWKPAVELTGWTPPALGRRAVQNAFFAAAFGVVLVMLYPRSGGRGLLAQIPRVLAAPVNFVGTISYTLFLVHSINRPIAENLTGRTLPATAPDWLNEVLQVGWHIALATPFWVVCERPFVRKRNSPASIARTATPRTAIAASPQLAAAHS